jgi:hypothetical protein
VWFEKKFTKRLTQQLLKTNNQPTVQQTSVVIRAILSIHKQQFSENQRPDIDT